jgi:hydrogenase maturation factor HypE
VIAPRESVDRVCKIFRKYQIPCKEIGIVDDRGKGEVTAILDQKQHTLSY